MSQSATIRTFSPSDLPSLIPLYRACFAEPPWHESFDPEELTELFTEIASWTDAIFDVAILDEMVVGGAIGFDLSRQPEVRALIPWNQEPYFYVSELFVASSARRRGLSNAFVQRHFTFARDAGYKRAAVRTSVDQPIIRLIYERLGFEVVASQDVESTKMIDGVRVTSSDHRIILAGSIP